MSRAAQRGPGRRQLRRTISWLLGLGLASTAAIAPALAEAELDAQLRERLGLDASFAVDINLSNIELRSFSRVLPDGQTRLSAELVRVRPSFDGVFIELEGLRATREPRSAPSPAPAPAGAAVEHTSDAEATRDPIAAMLQRLRGVPIDVRHAGELALELDTGLWLRARAIHLELPGSGEVFATADVELDADASERVELRGRLELATTDRAPRELNLSGVLLDATQAQTQPPALALMGTLDPRELVLTLETQGEAERGVATLHASRPAPGQAHLHLDADQLPLAQLDTLAAALLERYADTRELVQLERAQLSGTLDLDLGLGPDPGQLRVQLDGVALSGLSLDVDLLAAGPLHFDTLTLDGTLGRERGPTGTLTFGTLVLAHRGVQVEAAGQLDASGLSFDLQLPTSPCQAVFDAAPGISPVLDGTELDGQLRAHIGLDLDFAALAAARERFAADGAASFDLETFEPPGELRFELPYLEQCRVTRLGPGVDIEGLRGPYRHDFRTHAGELERRVLAHGDEGFVAIDRVPNLALAFVILEDSMFHRHDGFDREQLERAFWFNVLEGRVRRGASTITQQTARTLWLGIDRSLSRKLSEALLTAELERGLGKRRILEIYLNLIELGPGIHGVAEAAEYHFGKPASKLTLTEALHLASLAPAPVTYSRRFASGKLDAPWREHLRLQIRRLKLRKLISHEQAQRAMRLDFDLRAH